MFAKKRGRREPLSSERIEAAAAELIEEIGYEAFSARKLAARLGCEAMSIYHYFPSLLHLRDALFDRFVAGIAVPSDDLPWADRVRRIAWAYRAQALRHPRFFQAVVLHRTNTATGLRFLENVVSIFRDAGFDLETAARCFRVLGYYISGGALDEAAGYAKGPSAVEPVPDAIAARDYPLLTEINPWFKAEHHEATFALGLEMLIGCMERLLADKARAKPRPPAPKAKRAGLRSASRRATASRSSSR